MTHRGSLWSSLTLVLLAYVSLSAAQTHTTVCVAGQCLTGFTNISIGSTISTNPPMVLLPGQYSSTTQPQALHDALTSNPNLKLVTGMGPTNISAAGVSLPLNIALQPGLLSTSEPFYAGQLTFTALPNSTAGNGSTSGSISPGSLIISSNTWAALTISGGSKRIIIWDVIPDFSQLPSDATGTSLSLVDLQSASCSPACSGAGVCSSSGSCVCPKGFTGSSCESCASGFFGPECQPCPSGCATCDDGPTGTGKCIVPTPSNPPSSCNCLNGVCNGGTSCTCNAGWANASNGTACATCANGFFATPSGDCQICQLGCVSCSSGTGICTQCATGFTRDAGDPTRCNPNQSNQCGAGTFASGTSCQACSQLCKTCTGPTSDNCIVCGSGLFMLNGKCTPVDGNGVCSGSTQVANNVKNSCDSCPAKCTACNIPSFNIESTFSQIQCTKCVAGFVLSQGKCVSACPTGTFLGSDNLTCTPCDSSCATCVGSSTFCLTCNGGLHANNGQCVSSCPQNTFSSSNACLSCHADCATCSGPGFNQCSTCPANRPVLQSSGGSSGGRCLPTCSQNEFIDPQSATCKSCDPSCASCSGSGANACLSCAQPGQLLRAGSCVGATCSGGGDVLSDLGVCLSELVSSDAKSAPAPPVTSAPPSSGNGGAGGKANKLQWWQILLMVLGVAFIVLVALLCWRRRARKQRRKDTAAFADAMERKGAGNGLSARFARLRRRLMSWGPAKFRPEEEYFDPNETEAERYMRIQRAKRNPPQMNKYADGTSSFVIGRSSYGGGPYTPTVNLEMMAHMPRQPSIRSGHYSTRSGQQSVRDGQSMVHHWGDEGGADDAASSVHDMSGPSLYSQVTGEPSRAPQPRQPVRDRSVTHHGSKFSVTTIGTTATTQQQQQPLPRRQLSTRSADLMQFSPAPALPPGLGGGRGVDSHPPLRHKPSDLLPPPDLMDPFVLVPSDAASSYAVSVVRTNNTGPSAISSGSSSADSGEYSSHRGGHHPVRGMSIESYPMSVLKRQNTTGSAATAATGLRAGGRDQVDRNPFRR